MTEERGPDEWENRIRTRFFPGPWVSGLDLESRLPNLPKRLHRTTFINVIRKCPEEEKAWVGKEVMGRCECVANDRKITPKCEGLALGRGNELFPVHCPLHITPSRQTGKDIEDGSRENLGLSHLGSFKTGSVLMSRLKSSKTFSNLSTVTHLAHI